MAAEERGLGAMPGERKNWPMLTWRLAIVLACAWPCIFILLTMFISAFDVAMAKRLPNRDDVGDGAFLLAFAGFLFGPSIGVLLLTRGVLWAIRGLDHPLKGEPSVLSADMEGLLEINKAGTTPTSDHKR